LDQLYLVRDGILEGHDSFETSQFVPVGELFFDLASAFADEDVPLDISKALGFYRTAAGDHLIADGDEAYLLSHESGAVNHIGSLVDVVNRYFDADLTGGTWNPYDEARCQK